MAFGDGIIDSFYKGFQVGQLQKQNRLADEERLRKNKMRELFEAGYVPGTPGTTRVVGYGGEEYEPVDPVQAQAPSYNPQNAIAALYKGGFGPEAFEMESKVSQNEIAKILAGAKLRESMNPKAPTSRSFLSGKETVTQEFDTATGQWKEVGRGVKAPLVQVDTGTKEADKEFIKETRENFSRLRDAPTALKNIEEAKLLIPKAGVFMGTGGGTLLESAKFLNNRLGLQIQTEGVKSAEELRSRVFFQILENLKKMDASPSQKQQEVMMQALGNLDTDPNALASILDAFGDAVRDKVSTHNAIVTDAEKRGTKFPHRVTVDIPAKAGKGAIGTPPPKQKLGDIVDGPDGKKYRIIRLNKDGDHEIAPVQ